MEIKRVGSRSLCKYQPIEVTPFAVVQENFDKKIYVINSENKLEEFCSFQVSPRSGLQFDKVFWYQYDRIVAMVCKENEDKYLICDKDRENQVFISATTKNPSNICVISKDMFLSSNVLYSFPEKQEIMRIPISNESDYYVDSCMPLENTQYIVVFRDRMHRNYYLKRIDVVSKTVIDELRITRRGVLSPLSSHGFACMAGYPKGVEITIYDTDFREYPTIDIGGVHYCYEEVDNLKNCIYVVDEGGMKVHQINYLSEEREMIEIDGLKPNWLFICALDGMLYFIASKKTIKVFDTKKQEWSSYRFKTEVISCEQHNDNIFVLTRSDADNDFETGALIKEGVIEVYQFVP